MAERPIRKERSAYEAALVLLGARAHSSEELRRKLMRKGHEKSEVAAALERLHDNGLVDDAKFAAEFARSKLTGQRPASVRRIRQELLRRGVEGDVASEALDSTVSEEGIDERTGLEVAARKKLLSMGSLERSVQRRRLFSYLARKGYDLDDINRLLAQTFE
jgi:regulatory protein